MPTPLIIVLPVCRPDLHLALKWIKWVELLSRKVPLPCPLVVSYAPSLEPEEASALMIAASRVQAKAIHVRDAAGIPEIGYATANYMFKSALEWCEVAYPDHAPLWVEPDAIPMHTYWAEAIRNEYAEAAKPFLADFIYAANKARGDLDHFTGNAVYPPNWRQLCPSLAALPGPKIEQGWDSQCAREVLPLAHHSSTILQIWRPPTITDQWARANIPPGVALFHQDKHGDLIDVLCDRMGETRIENVRPVAPSSYPIAIAAPGSDPRVEILIVTCARDVDFLKYCLRSIEKHATGFSGVKVVVPVHEREAFAWIQRPFAVRYFDEPAGKGMLAHEVQKCRADGWCPDADFILHLDADCMFFRHVTPAAYILHGKALMVGEHYSKITNPNRHIWKDCVMRAVGIMPEVDAMVRHPQVHPIHTYRMTREAAENHTGRAFDEYVLAQQNSFPQGFAEFPTLASVGLRNTPGAYDYAEYDKAEDARKVGMLADHFQYAYRRERDYLVEWWSHGGIARYRSDCDAIMAGRVAEYYVK